MQEPVFDNDAYVRELIEGDNIDTIIAKIIYKLYGDDSFDRIEEEMRREREQAPQNALQQAIKDEQKQQMNNNFGR